MTNPEATDDAAADGAADATADATAAPVAPRGRGKQAVPAPTTAPTPLLLIAVIVAVASLAVAVFALARGGTASGAPGASPSDPNHEAHVALVGLWTCAKEEDRMAFDETLMLLDGGRYTRSTHASRVPPDSWMGIDSVSGNWEVQGETLLLTAESCTKYDAVSNKSELCLPQSPSAYKVKLPITDALAAGKSCTPLKRAGKRAP